jgi:hypothetical protein
VAYVIGILSEEEEAELTKRGWKFEPAPDELVSTDGFKSRFRMVWVDSSMFSIMNGPDWDKESG